MRIVDIMERCRTSVVIHCSDGWDRTAQVGGKCGDFTRLYVVIIVIWACHAPYGLILQNNRGF